MFKLLQNLDWVITTWIGQFLFFVFISFKLIAGVSGEVLRPGGWIFMTIYVLFFALVSINCFCFNIIRIREVFGVIAVCSGVFVVPMTYYELGGNVEVTSAVSLVYVLVEICMSPLLMGMVILVFALGYSAFIHYNNFFEQFPVFRESLNQINPEKVSQEILAPVDESKIKYFTLKTPATLQEVSSYDAVYGNKDYWFALYEANRKILKSMTGELPTGTKLIVPAAHGQPFRIRTYTVPHEATLPDISALPDVYGKAKYWRYLFEANKSKVIDTNLTVMGGSQLIVPELPQITHSRFLVISLIYIAAALVGLCWRILMQELYRLLSIALSSSTGQTTHKLAETEEMVAQLSEDVKRMKKELALHIVEIEQIINYHPPEANAEQPADSAECPDNKAADQAAPPNSSEETI